MYFRCLVGNRPRRWLEWLSWAEYCYNTSQHSHLRATPFELVYGHPPPCLRDYNPDTSKVAAFKTTFQDCNAFLSEVRERLLQTQQQSKHYYDSRHRDLSFDIGKWILQHWPMTSLPGHKRGKLAPRFMGHFRYLSTLARWHTNLPFLLVHVYMTCFMSACSRNSTGILPQLLLHCLRLKMVVSYLPPPKFFVAASTMVSRVLIQWVGTSEDGTTWEPLDKFAPHFPSIQLVLELLFEEGSDVMWGQSQGPQQYNKGTIIGGVSSRETLFPQLSILVRIQLASRICLDKERKSLDCNQFSFSLRAKLDQL